MSDENNDEYSSISTGSLHSIGSTDFFDYLDPCYFSPMYIASATNDVTMAREILQNGRVDINRVDNIGNTYLHIAVVGNSYDVMKLLLETRGIRIDVQNHHGNTPVHLVDDYRALESLIDAGANLNIQNNLDEPPLLLHLIRYPFEKAYKFTKLLLAAGANPNVFDHALSSLFSYIFYNNRFTDGEQIELVSMLLYYGADVNLKQGSRSISGFMYAVRKGSDAVIDLMIPYVTDFNEVSPITKCSLLMSALSRVTPKAIDFIHLNADINYSLRTNSCLSLSLKYSQSYLFKYIWQHCDKSYVLYTEKLFLNQYLCTNNLPKDEFLNNLYMILSSEYASYLVEEAVPHNLYDNLVKAFLNFKMEKDDRLRIIYTLLTISNRILLDDLFEVFTYYGFNEEIEAFMIINMEIINFMPFSNFITSLCWPFYCIDYCREFGHVDSLQQLSRDVIRKNLRRHVNNTFFQYYNEVQQMKIPQLIKDIICLKKLL